MSSTATLQYKVAPTPPLSLSTVVTALASVALSESDLASFGATLISDTTSNDGTFAIRTIQFDITSAEFQSNFPAGQEKSPFNDLFTSEIGGALGMDVVVEPVIIA
jgi:hypothetical protein